MEDFASIKTDISELMNDISKYLEQTRKGIMIDIGALPDQIVRLQGRMQNTPKDQRTELSNFMNQIMQSLNELSGEIQTRYDALTRNINRLDGSSHKE